MNVSEVQADLYFRLRHKDTSDGFMAALYGYQSLFAAAHRFSYSLHKQIGLYVKLANTSDGLSQIMAKILIEEFPVAKARLQATLKQWTKRAAMAPTILEENGGMTHLQDIIDQNREYLAQRQPLQNSPHYPAWQSAVQAIDLIEGVVR